MALDAGEKMSLKWDCMDDINVREVINDEESNDVSRGGFPEIQFDGCLRHASNMWYLTGLGQ